MVAFLRKSCYSCFPQESDLWFEACLRTHSQPNRTQRNFSFLLSEIDFVGFCCGMSDFLFFLFFIVFLLSILCFWWRGSTLFCMPFFIFCIEKVGIGSLWWVGVSVLSQILLKFARLMCACAMYVRNAYACRNFPGAFFLPR